MGFYSESEEWQIVNGVLQSKTKQLNVTVTDQREFATLQITFSLQRNSFYYTVTLVFPAVTLLTSVLSVTITPLDIRAPRFAYCAVTSSSDNDDDTDLEDPPF